MSDIIQTIKEKLLGVEEYGKYEDPLVEKAIFNTLETNNGEITGRDSLMKTIYDENKESVPDWEYEGSVEYPFSITVMSTFEKMKDDGVLQEEKIITSKGHEISKITIQQEL